MLMLVISTYKGMNDVFITILIYGPIKATLLPFSHH